MQIELTEQELHEIRCGLARNRSRIKNKLGHAKKSLEKYGGGRFRTGIIFFHPCYIA